MSSQASNIPSLAPGLPFPQGATLQNDGVNFSIFAEGSDADQQFDWGGDSLLGWPWHDCVIYGAQVRRATMQHSEIPEHLRRSSQ